MKMTHKLLKLLYQLYKISSTTKIVVYIIRFCLWVWIMVSPHDIRKSYGIRKSQQYLYILIYAFKMNENDL